MKEKKKALHLIFKCKLYTESEKNAKKLALMMAIEVLKQIPMYEGNLNPKWKFWDDVVKEINNYKITEKA
ncbi:hypothetical protein [Chryseobacterium sp. 2R14A]|uniref:hypothetical protein n=1 Tax=Chryseobacterium sp. 2R14A TaxID=3380353 RepID=UPI003CFB0896